MLLVIKSDPDNFCKTDLFLCVVVGGFIQVLAVPLTKSLAEIYCSWDVIELVLGAAFEPKSGRSTGAEVLLYKNFREHWQLINCKNFQPASKDDSVEALETSSQVDIICLLRIEATMR